MTMRLQPVSQHASLATAEDASKSMREPRIELGCLSRRQILSLARPDLTPRRSNEARPSDSSVAHGHASNSVSHATKDPTSPSVETPLLIAATLVKGGTDRWCDDCGRKISHSPLRLTYRQGRSVFVSWVHPHSREDEGQLPCAPDSPLVHAALATVRP